MGLNKAGKGQSVKRGIHKNFFMVYINRCVSGVSVTPLIGFLLEIWPECSVGVGNLSGLLKGKSGGGVSSILKHGLDLGEVGGVSDEVREFLAHGLLGQLVETVVLLPELFLNGHGGSLSERNIAKIERIEHTDSSLVPFVSLEMGELASLS